jgi:hypothetical protein
MNTAIQVQKVKDAYNFNAPIVGFPRHLQIGPKKQKSPKKARP